MVPTYAGLTTTLSATVATETTSTLSITNLTSLDVNIGDYLSVDDEIVRVKTTVGAADVSVSAFRGVLGTKAGIHTVGSVIRKLWMNPVELEDTLLFVLRVIHLNMLDMVQVTTLLHSLISKIVHFLSKKNFFHNRLKEMLVQYFTQV